jgi:hypothetical protein
MNFSGNSLRSSPNIFDRGLRTPLNKNFYNDIRQQLHPPLMLKKFRKCLHTS